MVWMMDKQALITEHIRRLQRCDRCPQMAKPVVTGQPLVSPMLLIGQAPGIKEPQLGRPFAWTAGKAMFQWFESAWGVDEALFRQRVYMAAVCRCYPGKNPKGGDRVPDRTEIGNCADWLREEFEILRPQLVLAVGKLAIQQFMRCDQLAEVVGRVVAVEKFSQQVDVIALPHPSGLSTWPRTEPGKTLLAQALALAKGHPAFRLAFAE